MRILLLSQFYPPLIGGEERHVYNLGAGLAARGHEVSVATIWHQGMADFELNGAVRVHRIRGTTHRLESLFVDSGHKHAPPFPDPEMVNALRKVIARERPEIVHAHNWLVHSFLPLKSWSRARLVLTVHDHSILCPKKKLIYNEVHCTGPALQKCFPCAREHYGNPLKTAVIIVANPLMSMIERSAIDMFVPVSRAVAEDNALFKKALPIEVIPNFVPDNLGMVDPQPHPNLTQLPAGDFILFVGAFGRYKGVDVLVQAYAHLTNAPPLVIIGYQTNEYPVQTTNFPSNIIILKDWPHTAVMQAWQRCLFGLIPSTWSDPCPTVAMEAMTMGKALIASRIGGLTDLVDDGATGFLIPPNDPTALCAAMQVLIDDPALRARMGAAAQRKVVDFQATTVITKLEHLYARLLHKSS